MRFRNSKRWFSAAWLVSAMAVLLFSAVWTPTAQAEEAALVLAQGEDPDAALAAGLRVGDAAAVEAALQAGADPNTGRSAPPLYLAATRGDPAIVTLLLEAGADPNGTGPSARSALVAALLRQNLEAAEILIANGADVNQREASPGRSPLQLVIDLAPSLPSMTLLLDAGADIDQADDRGETALASAAFMDRPEATQLLIDRGARIDVTNNEGVSPLEWARRQGNDEVIEILRQAGAE